MPAPQLLRDARLRAGLTQAELADRAGTSQATVSAYEAGRKDPTATTLARLLAATGSRLVAEPAAYRVVRPSPQVLEHRGRVLRNVLELAASLPSRHHPELRYPRLRS